MTEKADKGEKKAEEKPDTAEKDINKVDARLIEKEARKVTDEDIEKVVKKSDEIKKRFNPKGTLGRFVEDGQLLISLVKDYWNGRYRRIPFFALGAIVFSLLYVLNPWDFMPDFLPVIGQIDDAAVVSTCLILVERELQAYKAWKNQK